MGRYRMKAVSRLTGMRPELLRMWEKRYPLFKPHRAGNRYREFDDEDVQLLLYIRQQIEQGRTIGELAAEGREALLRQMAPGDTSQTQHLYTELIDEFMGYIQRLDKARMETRLAECMAQYTFATLLNGVFVSLLHKVGDLWAAQQLGIASERFATITLKQRLLSMLQATAPGADTPMILCACPAGESHELGLLTLAYTMQQHGWQVCYLGPDLPLHELQWSCRQVQPALVALSFTYVEDASVCLTAVQEIDASLASSYPTVVGGQAIERYQPLLHPRHLCLCNTPQAALSHARQGQTRAAEQRDAMPALGKPTLPE